MAKLYSQDSFTKNPVGLGFFVLLRFFFTGDFFPCITLQHFGEQAKNSPLLSMPWCLCSFPVA